MGFFGDDHVSLDEIIRMPFVDYMTYMFRQCLAQNFCRPAEGLGLALEYRWLGNNPPAFRLVQIFLHGINAFLVFLLARKISGKSFAGLIAALLYAGLPISVVSLTAQNAPEQSVTFYFLASILLWLEFLRRGNRWMYGLALVAAFLGLLNKEVGVMILPILFLSDRWLDGKAASGTILLRRYAPLLFVWTIYGVATLVRLYGFMFSNYTGEYSGMGVGPHIVWNFTTYAVTLMSLWDMPAPFVYLPVIFALSLIAYGVVVRRSIPTAFLCAMAVLTLLPVLPMTFTSTRFLYLSLSASVIGLAMLIDWARMRFGYSMLVTVMGASALTAIVLFNAFNADASLNTMSAFIRQYHRAPVRPILQAHSDFPPDTFLYFIDNPIPAKILSGMLTLRYGTDVTVNATDVATPADLRAHANAYVYYFDEEARAVEQEVTRGLSSAIAPALPIDFEAGIRLENYEVVRTGIRRGEPLIVLLYWRASQPVGIDYTLFAHLTNARGEMIAGVDGQPRAGKMPTSRWKPGALIVDWVLLPVPDDAPLGSDYRLEIGWYDSTTMQRSPMIGQDGTAHFVIAPFTIQ